MTEYIVIIEGASFRVRTRDPFRAVVKASKLYLAERRRSPRDRSKEVEGGGDEPRPEQIEELEAQSFRNLVRFYRPKLREIMRSGRAEGLTPRERSRLTRLGLIRSSQFMCEVTVEARRVLEEEDGN